MRLKLPDHLLRHARRRLRSRVRIPSTGVLMFELRPQSRCLRLQSIHLVGVMSLASSAHTWASLGEDFKDSFFDVRSTWVVAT